MELIQGKNKIDVWNNILKNWKKMENLISE